MIDPTLTGPLMEAAKEPLANITNPPTRSIGRFFGDTLDFWFSNRELKYAKKQIIDEVALRKFREECEAEFAKIPEEELVPPRKALLLPALDAAEYYVEEEELRGMFASLVAATFDARKASKVHPSFAGIIQELSPLDAGNLKHLFREGEAIRGDELEDNRNFFHYLRGALPVADIEIRFERGGYMSRANVILWKKPEFTWELDWHLYEISVSVLLSLGLVKYSFESYYVPNWSGKGYEESFMAMFDKICPIKEKSPQITCERKGFLSLTYSGYNFCEVCLSRSNKEAHP